ncbi:MAG: WD40 repeat domain-containing protein [Desulfurococcales archaeon]|nr:WD40 repeat domain-containing protein [Desulfurococcales archaeon]
MNTRSLIVVLSLLVLLSTPLLLEASSVNGVLSPGQELYSKQFYSGISGIDWSSDGEYIAVLLTSSRLAIFRSDGSLVGSYSLPHGTGQVAWRPGYDLVGLDAGTKVLVYSTSGSIVHQVDLGSRTVSIAWSFDGSRLAAGTDNGTLYMADFLLGRSCKCRMPGASITALAFTHDKTKLLIGDSNGFVKVYSLETLRVVSSIRLGRTIVRSIAVSPIDDKVAIMTDNATYLGLFNGTHVTIYAQEPYGGIGNVEWSPDGSVVFIPAENRGVVVASNGTIIDYVAPPEDYPILYAAWNPVEYSRLAIAGFNSIYGTGAMTVIYSGALVTVVSSTPVNEACWGGMCSSNLTFSPDEQDTIVKLNVEAYTPGGAKTVATVDLHLHLRPFQRLVIDAGKLLASGNADLAVENGKALIIVLHSPQARLLVESHKGWIEVPGIAVLVEPGSYKISLQLSKPSDYLGPEWVLVRNQTVELSKGQVRLLNYTWFKVSAVTAKLHVSSEKGATLKIIFPNSTASTVLESGEEDYTIPTGKYEVQVILPQENALVPSKDILSTTEEIAVYPGDKVTVSFHYSDVTGTLQIRAPKGSQVVIIPPWSTDLNPVRYNFAMKEEQASFRAYPGTYKVMVKPPEPPNFLGPHAPVGTANVTVVKGEAAVVDAYSISEVAEYLQLVDSSANVTILANKGYMIVIRASNETYRFNVTENVTLLLPPGKYKIDLVKPGKKLLIVKSKQLEVTGPGKITVNLLVKKAQGPSKPVKPVYTPEEGGTSKKKLAAAGVILVVVIIAVALLLKSRRGGEELTL